MKTIFSIVRKVGKSVIRALPLPLPLQEKILFFIQLGYWPDFESPESFCEKLHSRKLYEKDFRLVNLSDKLKVRKFVEDTIGSQYLIPLKYSGKKLTPETLLRLGDDIVVKRNDDSGSACVIRRNNPEISRIACEQLHSKSNYGQKTNERWYQEIDPCFLVEERLKGVGEELPPLDFKVFVFNQVDRAPYFIVEVIKTNSDGSLECSFYDEKMRPVSIKGRPVSYKGCALFSDHFPEEKLFTEMTLIAQKLGRDFNFVRIDLYAVQGRIYFGEMTFNPAEGRFRVEPVEFDRELGKRWELPVLLSDCPLAS